MTPEDAKKIAIQIMQLAAQKIGHDALAKRLKCSRQAVYLWANGKRTIPAYACLIAKDAII